MSSKNSFSNMFECVGDADYAEDFAELKFPAHLSKVEPQSNIFIGKPFKNVLPKKVAKTVNLDFPREFKEKDLSKFVPIEIVCEQVKDIEKKNRTNLLVEENLIKPFENAEKPRAITSISDKLASSECFRVYNITLYTYSKPIWNKCSDGNEFISVLRDLFSELDEYWNSFKKIEFSELYTKLVTNPEIGIKESDIEDTNHYICFSDALYNIETYMFEELKPDLFFRTFIDVRQEDINGEDGMAFDDFLNTCSSNDMAIKNRLEEVIASCLFPGPFKGFHLLLGYSNTGKSLFANVLADIFGQKNYCAISDVNDLSGRWAMGQIVEKKLCICTELNDSKISKDAIRALKQAVGDDPVMVEEKYKAPVTARCNARFIVASNFMLDTDSIADPAFENRLKITPFTNPIPQDKMNIMLRKELTTKASKGYIVWLGLQAMERWMNNNFHFTEIEIPEDLIRSIDSPKDLVKDFIKHQCITTKDESDCVSVENLFEVYSNLFPAISFSDFSKKISHFAPIEWKKSVLPKSKYGKQIRGYRYVKIRKE